MLTLSKTNHPEEKNEKCSEDGIVCCCCVLLKMSSTRRTSSLSSSPSTTQKTTKEFRVVAGGNITKTKTKKRSLSLSFSHHGRRRSRDGRYSQVRERSLLSFFCLLKSTHSKRDMMFQINNNMRFSTKIRRRRQASMSECLFSLHAYALNVHTLLRCLLYSKTNS